MRKYTEKIQQIVEKYTAGIYNNAVLREKTREGDAMQTCDAEFYPVATKKRGRPIIKILVGLLCAALLTALAVRVYKWMGQRQETELLALVNPWNDITTAQFTPQLTDIGDGKQADKRCLDDLELMLAECAAAGNEPYICSAYRSWETQEALFADKVRRVIEGGTRPEDAPDEAARSVARPGTSEHELGLAFDIVDGKHQDLDESQADTPTQKWLLENSWRYGFILRYPADGESVTGVIYEPWHYRYVGPDAARQISQLGLTLEEYISMFYSEEAKIKFEG